MGRKAVHEHVSEILPWFVNESMGERERRQVLAHLKECAECRSDRDRLQALQTIMAEDDGSEAGAYEVPFRRLMGRISVAEANRRSVSAFERRRRLPVWMPWMGVAASLLVVVVFVGFLNPPAPKQVEYRTLSSNVESPGTSHRIALTFDQPIRADTLRAALIETNSNIVSGPDKNGTYIVDIRVPPTISDRAFIQSLRKIDGVKYAAFEGEPSNLAR